jgi:hypothetical protein
VVDVADHDDEVVASAWQRVGIEIELQPVDVEVEVGRRVPGALEGNGGYVCGVDRIAVPGKIECIATGTTGDVERTSRRQAR